MLSFGFNGCGGSSTDSGNNITETPKEPEIIDYGFWGNAFSDDTYEKPYNCKGNLFYYKLSCRHNGVEGGEFYIYEDRSAVVVRTDNSIENCTIEKIFEEKEPIDTHDINATMYSSNVTSDTTWYDTSTKIYYDTERYQLDGQMIGIVNNGFEALIQDNTNTETQTIRLFSEYIEVTPQ